MPSLALLRVCEHNAQLIHKSIAGSVVVAMDTGCTVLHNCYIAPMSRSTTLAGGQP